MILGGKTGNGGVLVGSGLDLSARPMLPVLVGITLLGSVFIHLAFTSWFR